MLSTMTTTHPRRIIKRTLWALAVVVLLPVWYVGAWLTLSKAANEGLTTWGVALHYEPVFEPLLAYCRSGQPGSKLLCELWWAVNPPHELHNPEWGTVLIEPAPLAPPWLVDRYERYKPVPPP